MFLWGCGSPTWEDGSELNSLERLAIDRETGVDPWISEWGNPPVLRELPDEFIVRQSETR